MVTDENGSVVYSDTACIRLKTDTWTYTYDANGMRTQRSDGYTTYTYVYDSGSLSRMTAGDDVLTFGYDANGAPVYIQWNTVRYLYVTNLQGDIVGILDSSGNEVVTYTYDPWGNILSVTGTLADTLGELNPLRYRGYVYDTETGLYYLQSRYYNPEWGRFINADALISTGQGFIGNNMFAYCNNSAINKIDPNGRASYTNTVSNIQNGYYDITTVISFWWTRITLKYQISKNGIIKFDFTKHNNKSNYWSVLWRGGSSTLAAAMYKAAKSINSRFLYGRSISGINTELQLHYVAYVLGIKPKSSYQADMGALSSRKTGYDSNAWFFETANAARIATRYNIYAPYGIYSLIRNIARYF